jgi:hypothetical protein
VSKQHYFVIYGERADDGVIEWRIDADMPVNMDDLHIYNTEAGEWEDIIDNQEEDLSFTNELLKILAKDYDMLEN